MAARCIDMPVGMCYVNICIDMCIDMRMDMHLDVHTDMPTYIDLSMILYIAMHGK